MAVNNNSVPAMKAYLKYALDFEKNVYIWTKTMDELNDRIVVLNNEKVEYESKRNQTDYTLSTIAGRRENERQVKEKEAKKYIRKSKRKLTSTIIACLFFLILAIGLFSFFYFTNGDILTCLFLGGGVPLLFAFIILPMFAGSYAHTKAKAKSLENEVKALSSIGALERQRTLLANQNSTATTNLELCQLEEAALNIRQDEIFEMLKKAKATLKQIYSVNMLPEKYHNLNAVATFYEYLMTGRCNTIQGHGGIYDTYEKERIQLAQLEQMIMTNIHLANIEDTQRFIYQELQQANATLDGIRSSLSNIEATNAEIAKNTAITAVASQQTAEAAQWFKWRAMSYGY